jgi:hypothetical protein
VSNPSNGTVNADGTVQLIDGKAPLDPATNLIYNDKMLSFGESVNECNKMCAHLATFASQQDQHDAEAYFIGQVGIMVEPARCLACRLLVQWCCTSMLLFQSPPVYEQSSPGGPHCCRTSSSPSSTRSTGTACS